MRTHIFRLMLSPAQLLSASCFSLLFLPVSLPGGFTANQPSAGRRGASERHILFDFLYVHLRGEADAKEAHRVFH